MLQNFSFGLTKVKIHLSPMGVLAPGSAHGRPSAQPPIDTSGKAGNEDGTLAGIKASTRPVLKLIFMPFQGCY